MEAWTYRRITANAGGALKQQSFSKEHTTSALWTVMAALTGDVPYTPPFGLDYKEPVAATDGNKTVLLFQPWDVDPDFIYIFEILFIMSFSHWFWFFKLLH